ncbi:MAG: glycyl-radical enzyme activating protein, partial [Clostridia bacterium]|nr:glycyl-radical enzyme activating protein [Clostridia bacterium]
LPYTDTYLYDIKCLDPDIHQKYTGRENQLILQNLQRLAAAGANIWIRVPVIPDVNDDPAEMEGIAALAANTPGVTRVTLMPYHTLGKSKYQTLGMTPGYETTKLITESRLEAFKAMFREKGLSVE